jgi:pyruvate dehydrogenase E2 component (dihydrolipoamide acetyltransferase)
MKTDVTMPNLGYEMEEGKIQRWLKQVGDAVDRGEPIAEIETDKTTVEMEAMASGTLAEIVVAEGESAPLGAVIAVIESAD